MQAFVEEQRHSSQVEVHCELQEGLHFVSLELCENIICVHTNNQSAKIHNIITSNHHE